MNSMMRLLAAAALLGVLTACAGIMPNGSITTPDTEIYEPMQSN